MRKKGLAVLGFTVVLSLASVFSSYAGEWRQEDKGWWYQNADSSYLSNGWYWIDGRCYYFDSNGYCLQNTVTPDNYIVDASGAWTLNGVVQTRQTDINLKTITVQIPNGYYANVENIENGMITLYETNSDVPAAFVLEDIDDIYSTYDEESYASQSERIANEDANSIDGYDASLLEKGISTYNNRDWYYYVYLISAKNSIVFFPSNYYLSYSDNSCVLVLTYSTREILSGKDFVKNYIK